MTTLETVIFIITLLVFIAVWGILLVLIRISQCDDCQFKDLCGDMKNNGFLPPCEQYAETMKNHI